MPSLDYFILGEGKEILFLHGWGHSKESMMDIVNVVKHKYKCIVIDLPGFGRSKYNNEKELDEYCKRIHSFLVDELKIYPKYIVGHSFGGKVGVHYYLKYKRIKGLILMQAPIVKVKRGVKYYFRVYLYKICKLFKIKTNMGSRDYKNCKDNMRKLFVNVVNKAYDNELSKINIPLLLIYSKSDKSVSYNNVKKIKRKVNNVRVRDINGNHFSSLNNPNKVAIEINDFIKENERKYEYYL